MTEKAEARILIVEDNTETWLGIQAALVKAGYKYYNIINARNLEDAIEIFDTFFKKEELFDAYSLDLELGGDLLAGLKFADYIANKLEKKSFPVLFYSRFWKLAKEHRIHKLEAKISSFEKNHPELQVGFNSPSEGKEENHEKLVVSINNIINKQYDGYKRISEGFEELKDKYQFKKIRLFEHPRNIFLLCVVALSVAFFLKFILLDIGIIDKNCKSFIPLFSVLIGYIFWFILLFYLAKLLPKTERDYFFYLVSNETVRTNFETAIYRCMDAGTKVNIESEADDVANSFEAVNRNSTSYLIESYICLLLTIILLQATYMTVLVKSSIDPTLEYANMDIVLTTTTSQKELQELSDDCESKSCKEIEKKLLGINNSSCNEIKWEVSSVENENAWIIKKCGLIYKAKQGEGRVNIYKIESFFSAFYFSIIETLTIGFGDIHPRSDTAKFGCILQGISLTFLVLLGPAYLFLIVQEKRNIRSWLFQNFQTVRRITVDS